MPTQQRLPDADPSLTVVKIGGSLAATPARLRPLLEEIGRAAARGRRIVVVPGGGPFADAVRAAQQVHGFDDAHAHDMAIEAMAQYGRLLSAVGGLRCARGLPALRTALAAPGVADRALAWLPDPQADALQLEHSWRVSADSLALWLATALGAPRLVLVKSCPAPAHTSAGALSRAGILDAAYPELAAAAPQVSASFVFDASAEGLRASLAEST